MICGGVNSKTPLAGAVWRQGHLLHFGFEQSPAEMNRRGRALLVNAICYISPRAIEAWKKPGSGESLAEKLLRRYVPEGPKRGATPDEWRKWWENRPYLFYSDPGGYRWYVNPLAKNRQTPCSELRGTKRATGQPIAAAAAG